MLTGERAPAPTTLLALGVVLLGACESADAEESDDPADDPACTPTVTFADPVLAAQLYEDRPRDTPENPGLTLTGNPIELDPLALLAECGARDIFLSPFYCYFADPGS